MKIISNFKTALTDDDNFRLKAFLHVTTELCTKECGVFYRYTFEYIRGTLCPESLKVLSPNCPAGVIGTSKLFVMKKILLAKLNYFWNNFILHDNYNVMFSLMLHKRPIQYDWAFVFNCLHRWTNVKYKHTIHISLKLLNTLYSHIVYVYINKSIYL